jgi:hypothetical protein
MKTKPNTEQFSLEKALSRSNFLEGGIADAADKDKTEQNAIINNPNNIQILETKNKIYREQKVFRLQIDIIQALKRESYERSIREGYRVTETELVETALKQYLNIDR